MLKFHHASRNDAHERRVTFFFRYRLFIDAPDSLFADGGEVWSRQLSFRLFR
jgi:hypothetical protein